MPGDVRDPTQMFPYHYDDRYERTIHPTEMFGMPVDGIIQALAEEVIGHPLGKEDLRYVHQWLNQEGLLSMNPGDEQFTEAVRTILQDKLMSRKVARTWLTSIS